MRRRELLMLSLSIAWLIAGAAWWLLFPPSPTNRINRGSFDAIREGMSVDEVEAILGGPAGDYRTGKVEIVGFLLVDPSFSMRQPDGLGWSEWEGDKGTVTVWFDRHGKALETDFTPMRLKYPPLRERLRRWLGLTGDE